MPPPRPITQTQQRQYQESQQASHSPQMHQQFYQNYQQSYVQEQQQRQYQTPQAEPVRLLNQTMGPSQSLQNFQLDGTSQERPRSRSNSQYAQNYIGNGKPLQPRQREQISQQAMPQPILNSNVIIPPQSSPQQPPLSRSQQQQQSMTVSVHQSRSDSQIYPHQSSTRVARPEVVIEIAQPKQRQQFHAPVSATPSSRVPHDRPESVVTPQRKSPLSSQPVSQSRPSSVTPREPSASSRPLHPQPLPAVQRVPFSSSHIAKTKAASVNPQPPSETPNRPAASSQTSQLSRPATTADTHELPVDYQVLLLALADEYFSKAHSMTARLVRSQVEADLEQYHSLVATGLGCIESVLKNWKFPEPRTEARLQLRCATLLFEETDNEGEAQELLNKGITLCERHRLVDLKYSMLHLQARLHFRSRPRAALKMIDQLVPTMEAYKQTAWVYAFRFLRVSLCLQMPRQSESIAALQQLRSISALAGSLRHYPILAISAAIEALIHLRSDGSEAIELSQRAIAAARKHQLDPGLAALPQVTALMDCLDLCCDLVRLSPEQSLNKMRAMQQAMDSASADRGLWRADGTFCVPLGEPATADIDTDSNGIFERTSGGQRGLVFSWIRKSELYAIGYIISGATTTHKNGVDHKAEKYLIEGSKITEGMLSSASRQHDNYSRDSQKALTRAMRRRCSHSMRRILVETKEHTTTISCKCNSFLPNAIDRIGTEHGKCSDPGFRMSIYHQAI